MFEGIKKKTLTTPKFCIICNITDLEYNEKNLCISLRLIGIPWENSSYEKVTGRNLASVELTAVTQDKVLYLCLAEDLEIGLTSS